NGSLSFTIAVGPGARNLRGMLPYSSASGILHTIKRGGADVEYEVVPVKGIEYARFNATAGSYVATYAPDVIAPTITSRNPSHGATSVSPDADILVGFSEPLDPATVTSAAVELRTGSGSVLPAAVSYIATT